MENRATLVFDWTRIINLDARQTNERLHRRFKQTPRRPSQLDNITYSLSVPVSP